MNSTSDVADPESFDPENAREALRQLAKKQPERHPIIVGLVAPLGVAIDPVLLLVAEAFAQFNYSAETIRLSSFLDESEYHPWEALPEPGQRTFYTERMNAGDRLRTDVQHGAALGALSVAKIQEFRENGNAETAFILRSLKHPDEVRILRHVYGDAFVLVGIASSTEERKNSLEEKMRLFDDASSQAEALIARDEKDSTTSFGQNVRETYAMADVFIPSARGFDPKKHVDRFVDSLFGAPFLTPTQHEEGMRIAYDASLRSSSMGRQVGAALIPPAGTPVVVGTNEVPRPGGGQFWTGQEPDFRDFQTGMDPNPLYTQKVVQELLERLKELGWLSTRFEKFSGEELLAEAVSPKTGKSILSGSRVNALIEFTRCLHAEQAAIVNAARAGVSTVDATLYTTTFPCHECAKFILGAGISEVHYVEPYPKSLVARLYRDLIDVTPSPSNKPGLVDGKVPFRPFVGLAPSRYALAFTAGERRFAAAQPAIFERQLAFPRTSDWNTISVEQRQADVTAAIKRVIKSLAAESSSIELEKPSDPEKAIAPPKSKAKSKQPPSTPLPGTLETTTPILETKENRTASGL